MTNDEYKVWLDQKAALLQSIETWRLTAGKWLNATERWAATAASWKRSAIAWEAEAMRLARENAKLRTLLKARLQLVVETLPEIN